MATEKSSVPASSLPPSQKSTKKAIQNERGSFASTCSASNCKSITTETMAMSDSSSTLGLHVNIADLHLADGKHGDHASSEAAVVVVDIPTIGACVGVDIFSDGSLSKFAEECLETLPSDEERRSQH